MVTLVLPTNSKQRTTLELREIRNRWIDQLLWRPQRVENYDYNIDVDVKVETINDQTSNYLEPQFRRLETFRPTKLHILTENIEISGPKCVSMLVAGIALSCHQVTSTLAVRTVSTDVSDRQNFRVV